MTREDLQARLAALEQQYQQGRAALGEIQTRCVQLEGAMALLRELLASQNGAPEDARPEAPAPEPS